MATSKEFITEGLCESRVDYRVVAVYPPHERGHMGKINSKQKGKNGELELSHKLQDYGYDNVRRSQQYAGIHGDADLVNLDGIYIECKRVEKLNIYDAMSQAIHDSGENGKGELPTVFHRKNRCDWLVTMKLEDWIQLYREWDSSNKLKEKSND